MEKNYKINFKDYSFPEDEGTFRGKVAFTLYGKKNNIVAYLDLDNGEKIIAVAYKDTESYSAIQELAENSSVSVTFERTKTGRIRLDSITELF